MCQGMIITIMQICAKVCQWTNANVKLTRFNGVVTLLNIYMYYHNPPPPPPPNTHSAQYPQTLKVFYHQSPVVY